MSKGKQPAATTQTTTTEFPSELRPYITDILERSKARAEAEEKAGYQAYTGPRIAGFDPSQLAAQARTEDVIARGVSADPMLSSAQTYYRPALGLTLGQAERFGDVASQYMSPYQQAVVDVEKREAARGFAPQLQDIRAKSVGAGGFGGSRGALLESEAMRNQAQLLSDIQTRGSQAAFQSGQAAFEAQKARERGAAGGLAAMGAAIPGQAFKEIGALEAMGAGRRADTQRALDLAYSQFQEEQLFPTRTLQEYQSIVRGFPYTPNTYTTGFTTTPPASMAQNILGLGTGIAGLAGAFGGFAKEGGHMAKLKRGRTPKDAPIQEAYEEGGDEEGSKLFDLEQMKRFFYYPAEILGADVPRDAPGVATGTIFGTESNIADVDEMPISEGLPLVAKEAGQQLKRAAMYPAEPILGAPDDAPGSPIITVGEAAEGLLMMPRTDEQIKKMIDDRGGKQTTSTKTDVKTAPKATDSGVPSGAMDSPVEDINKPTVTDTSPVFTLPKNTKLTDLEKLLEASAKEIKDRKILTPEMEAFKKEYADLKSKLGEKEKSKKSELKKQKYLQLAQFGLNVLSADPSKGDLQIIGEAGKQPLAEVGRIVGEEGDITDKTDAQRLAILGKEAEIAQQVQTGERQKLADTLSLIGKQVDLQKARNESMNIDSSISQSTVTDIISTSPFGDLIGDAQFAPLIQEEVNAAYNELRDGILANRIPDDNLSATAKFREILSRRLSSLKDRKGNQGGDTQVPQGNKPPASQTLSGNY